MCIYELYPDDALKSPEQVKNRTHVKFSNFYRKQLNILSPFNNILNKKFLKLQNNKNLIASLFDLLATFSFANKK